MAISAQATQDFVPIKEVRDGIVTLKDGSVRAIIMASSVNLSLKSYDEQTAVIMQFQSFLNSLDFDTQIVIQSRRYDVKPYLILLENRMKEQMEPLLKVQTREYIEFIRVFNEQVNIMTKNFFVVVPYTGESANLAESAGMLAGIFKSKRKKEEKMQDDMMAFEEKRSQLEQRIGVIEQGLNRLGVKTERLGTEEVIELFYKTFNPGDAITSIKAEL